MDFDKLKQWMEMAQKYQSGSFWNGLFDQSSFNKFMKETMESPTETAPQAPDKPFPNIDIYVTDAEVIVVAELAGYTKENLHLSVSGSKLLLKGTSSHMVAGQPVIQERHQGPFERFIELPEPALSNQIKATFRNGLLTLTYKRNYYQEERVTIE